MLRRRTVAAAAAAGWAILTADFSWRRIRPGPRDRVEVLKMLTTSAAIPPAATWHWTRALLRSTGPSRRSAVRAVEEPFDSSGASRLPAAVLVDRDGTIVQGRARTTATPTGWNRCPERQTALQRLRGAGIPIAVITNQSGIGRGLIDRRAVDAVNARIDALLGPFDAWVVCPHTDADGCDCRKPEPGLVHQAARRLGVSPAGCVVIGDIGADMGSAQAAGARAILVPTPQTRPEEVRAAPRCAADADRRRRRRAGRTVLTWPVIDWWSGWTAWATCWRPGRRSARWRPALTGSRCSADRPGSAAAQLLPGVDATVVWACPWIVNPPPAISRSEVDDLIDRIAGLGVDQAVILTSFHQSPLPTALLLRLAGVPWIAAASEDYPGSLLDARLPVAGDAPEPVRMLQTVRAAGFELPAGDDGRLRVRRPLPDVDAVLPSAPRAPLVVVHPGTSAPARAYPEPLWAAAVDRLVQDGWQVALTGSAAEQPLTGRIVAAVGGARGRASSTWRVGSTSRSWPRCSTGRRSPWSPTPAPPTSPPRSALRWSRCSRRWCRRCAGRPFGVPVELLGDQEAPCRDTRWTSCRIAGHPCLSSVSADEIASAVRLLAAADPAPLEAMPR